MAFFSLSLLSKLQTPLGSEHRGGWKEKGTGKCLLEWYVCELVWHHLGLAGAEK